MSVGSGRAGRNCFVITLFLFRGFSAWIEGAEAKCKAGYGSPNNLEESTAMVTDCKAWVEMTAKDSFTNIKFWEQYLIFFFFLVLYSALYF